MLLSNKPIFFNFLSYQNHNANRTENREHHLFVFSIVFLFSFRASKFKLSVKCLFVFFLEEQQIQYASTLIEMLFFFHVSRN